MLTGKQTTSAALTFVALLATYFCYEQLAGRLTDYELIDPLLLTPLADDDKGPGPGPRRKESAVAAERAFGADKIEGLLGATFALEYYDRTRRDLAGRGVGTFLYFEQYELKHEGNPRLVKLWPMTVVSIEQSGDGDPAHDEISSVRGEHAVLVFDRDVDPIKLVSNPKPVAGWIQGNVRLGNNRRTDPDADDMHVFTDRLDYDQSKSMIWALGNVRVTGEDDLEVTGLGMELDIEPPPPKGAKPQPKGKRGAAKAVRLLKDVRMRLMVADNESPLGEAPKPPPGTVPAKGKAAKKNLSPLLVSAKGPFSFDLAKNFGRFDRSVSVVRPLPPAAGAKAGADDQLLCDRLDLQFAKGPPAADGKAKPKGKAKAATAGADDDDPLHRSLSLQTAEATGEDVVLRSAAQKLTATGNYLFHDAAKRWSRLTGKAEAVANVDNAFIHARSLVIEQTDAKDTKPGTPGGNVRQLTADGPNGYLSVLGKDRPKGKDGAEQPDLRIWFAGRLTVVPENGTDNRLVSIFDDVRLELPLERLTLASQEMRIKLEPSPGADGKEKKLQPTYVHALRHVSVVSPTMLVNTDDLTMHIRDKPSAAVGPGGRPLVAAVPVAAAPVAHGKQPQPAPPRVRETAKKDEPAKPMDVKAQKVVVWAERADGKTDPTRATAEGRVTLLQAGKGPTDDDAFQVTGRALEFVRRSEGDRVVVFGGEDREAVIVNRQLELHGERRVVLDEATNETDVKGPGWLNLLQAGPLTAAGKDAKVAKAAPPRPLKVTWRDSMHFDGLTARFDGKVRAQQETPDAANPAAEEIECAEMQVEFKDKVVFRDSRQKREGEKRPKNEVATVDCAGEVVARQGLYAGKPELGKLDRYGELTASTARWDNRIRTVAASVASGDPAGVMTMVERQKPRPDDETPAPPFLHTRVQFGSKMTGEDESKNVKFFDAVRILRAHVGAIDELPDAENLPAEGMLVDKAGWAEVTSGETPQGEKYQDFLAKGANLKFQTKDYYGSGNVLKFNSRQNKVTLESDSPDRRASLFKQVRPGEAPSGTEARVVTYNTKTGAARAERATGMAPFEMPRENEGRPVPPRRSKAKEDGR